MSRNLVLCLGRTYADLIFAGLTGMPVLGQERFAPEAVTVPGGGAFITAAHLAALNRRAALVSRLGTDSISEGLAAPIAASGIDIRFIERAADAGPQITVVMVHGQERAFLTRRAGKARPESLEAALTHPDASHLHIGEAASLVEIPDLVARAKACGLTVSLDPSWDDAVIHRRDLIGLCRGVDLFLPNAEEARALTGRDDPEAALETLASHFPLVVLKLGARGAMLSAYGTRLTMPAPLVPVVDTTGAGDAFNAGFLAAWLDREPLEACLGLAIATGSRAVGQLGGAAH